MATDARRLATGLVLLTCLVWRAGAFQPSPPTARANELTSGIPGEAPENTAEERGIGDISDYPHSVVDDAADISGGTVPEGPGSPASTSGSGGVFNRLFSRFRQVSGSTQGRGVADEPQQGPRPSLRERLAQHFRRLRVLFGRLMPRWGFGFGRHVGRWWPRRWPDPLFPCMEPGDEFIRYLVRAKKDRIGFYRRGMVEGYEVEVKAVTAAIWPQNTAREVASLLDRRKRTLRVVGAFGRSVRSVLYLAQDVETQEHIAAEVFTLTGESRGLDLQRVHDNLFLSAAFLAESPVLSRDRRRLLLPYDAVTVPSQPPFEELNPGQSNYPVANYFLLMPPPMMSLETLHRIVDHEEFLTGDIGRVVRMVLTAELIRIAANIQIRGLVHGRITSETLFIMPDGRLMLGDVSALRKVGTRGPVSSVPVTYAPREFLSNTETAAFTHALDAWQLGLVIHRIWCLILPFGLVTPRMKRSGRRPSMRVPGLDVLSVEACTPMPDAVEMLVRHFLNFNTRKRLLPLTAMGTPEFRQLQLDISTSLSSK
ncbi:rhoptry kinase family protein (incomplete catalytic triad) [Toxoplasma gondii ME49]|uniref:Rhoptry kinase family protein (Incomplete catalytic triad) n=4 Tax=Toxoplasma gondii TaxID=5811 RepID=S8EQS5_TOXGM|nr:rhoptry kinase family protein (incomplete catalytic triad) [Toxoplasma gondii ME49]EPT24567.1 rhoptry kinase family protein (incomplete catalytic triad) [Toxoplasma gondii ME49]QDQ69401.1 rhoptry kinase family protein [Toxoplasma gondii]|eukprot:XP_018634780.1 rhoptry kinase family protein (incomplete catalytic triad) [Toxoplasma gondii ME49]